MKLSIKVASTSQTVNVFIRDSSSSTGAGLAGLAFNTASLTAYYLLPKAAAVAITLATQTVTGAWSSGGFKEIDATNAPGWYRLDIPDAALASGRFVDLHLKGATNMAPCPVEIELTGWDNQNATTGGLTDIDATISSRSTYAGADTSGTTTLLTRVPGTVQPQTGDAFARLGVAGVGLTNLGDTRIAHLDADISSRTKPADTQAAVTLVATTTTVTDKAGFSLTAAYDPAKTAAQAGDAMALTSGERTTLAGVIWANASRTLSSFGTLVADTATAVWAALTRSLTDKTGFSLTGAYDAAKTAADASTVTSQFVALDADVLSRLATAGYTAPDNAGVAAIEAKTNNLPASPAAVSDIPTADANADALLKRDWTAVSGESLYSALNALRNMRNHVVISGSTVTVYKEDGTTPAYTLTIATDVNQAPIVAVMP